MLELLLELSEAEDVLLELLLLLDCCSEVEELDVSPSLLVELELLELEDCVLSELLLLELSECNSVLLELEV